MATILTRSVRKGFYDNLIQLRIAEKAEATKTKFYRGRFLLFISFLN